MARKNTVLRRCMICRQYVDTDEMLRFVRAKDGEIIFDRMRRLGLRGTWVCAEGNCLTKIANKSSFERVFKGPVVVDIESLKLSTR